MIKALVASTVGASLLAKVSARAQLASKHGLSFTGIASKPAPIQVPFG